MRRGAHRTARAAGGSPLNVRPIEPADLAAVIDLDRRNTGRAKPDYWQDLYQRYRRRRDERFFLVAESNTKLLGFVAGEIRAWEFGSPPCGWVFAIHVEPGARLKGVGTRLLAAIGDCFRRAGVTRLRTMLARTDSLNLRFFRSQGMMAGPFIELEKELR
jgi:GNAT superfamily N-acetyltransferase